MFWIPVVVATVALAAVFVLWAAGYRKVGPGQVLVVTGRGSTVTGPDGERRRVGYRLMVGGGTFVMPFTESVDVLPLEVQSVPVRCPEVLTAQGILLSVEAQGQVKASSEPALVHRAVENFLTRGAAGIAEVARDVLEGHVRTLLGTMTVEQIYGEREDFSRRLRTAAEADLARMGLELVSFSLKDVTDAQGYLQALGARRIAEVKRDAAIAMAETERDAVIRSTEARSEGDIARLRAEADLADATREFEIRRADSQAEVNARRAKADASYDLERARLDQELKRQEYTARLEEKELAARVEEKEVVRREKELEATVRRPAEAMQYQARLEAEAAAYKAELEAKGKAAGIRLYGEVEAGALAARGHAEAEAMKEKATAYRGYSEAAMAEMVVKILPELARAVSEPLSKVEKIVMVGDGSNGAPKLTAQVGQVLAQLPTVVQSLTGIDLPGLLANGKKEHEKTKA